MVNRVVLVVLGVLGVLGVPLSPQRFSEVKLYSQYQYGYRSRGVIPYHDATLL